MGRLIKTFHCQWRKNTKEQSNACTIGIENDIPYIHLFRCPCSNRHLLSEFSGQCDLNIAWISLADNERNWHFDWKREHCAWNQPSSLVASQLYTCSQRFHNEIWHIFLENQQQIALLLHYPQKNKVQPPKISSIMAPWDVAFNGSWKISARRHISHKWIMYYITATILPIICTTASMDIVWHPYYCPPLLHGTVQQHLVT